MMPARRPLIAGNWKMNKGGPAGGDLAAACVKIAEEAPLAEILIAPPFTAIAACAAIVDEQGGRVLIAGQNLYPKDSGAFTGEVSAPMLKDAGATWVIVGHSERRQYFGETDALVAEKTAAALKAGLLPIACVGETLAEREAGRTLEVVERQVRAVIEPLATSNEAAAIAYEPVWAIGTGKNASPEDAEEVHAAIRKWLEQKSSALAERTRILYGGSVKADNAEALFRCPNVDGGLIGGASLDAGSFGAIARAAQLLAQAQKQQKRPS